VRNGFLNFGFGFEKNRWFGFFFGSVLWRPLIYFTWRAGLVVLLLLSLTIMRTGHHSYDGRKHNRLYCRTWWYCSFINIIMRMTPLLNNHSDIHREKVVAYILILVFIKPVFKNPRKPELQVWLFGHGSIRFGFLKTETEPTFGLPHMPNSQVHCLFPFLWKKAVFIITFSRQQHAFIKKHSTVSN